MAFRILPNGAQECDTIEEFRQLRSERGRSAPSPGKRRSTKSQPADLSESARLFLHALMKSPAGLNTEKVSSELNISAKKVPPILRLLTKWSVEHKHDLDALMTRKSIFVNRRPQTEYQLTAEGLKIFGRVVGAHSMNGKESTMNTG